VPARGWGGGLPPGFEYVFECWFIFAASFCCLALLGVLRCWTWCGGSAGQLCRELLLGCANYDRRLE
jgi:hypothetical protein